MDLFNTIFFAFLAGVLPSVIWLAFWLREDEDHPEPRGYIVRTFAYGALAVPCALILQVIFNKLVGVVDTDAVKGLHFGFAVLIVGTWASIEEYVKYRAAWYGGLRKQVADEAVDIPIYMISAALGFAALENTLFVLAPLLNNDFQAFIATTKLRFVGSTLVHVACSALIGMFAGYSLFFTKAIKKYYLVAGFVLSIVLHTLFNLFIIKHSQNSFAGFFLIWSFVILIIVLFERIKKIKVNTINNVREKEKENSD